MTADPPLRNLLTDVAGIMVGHATDTVLGSGVTAIVFDAPCAAAVTIRGGAPGSRETALLSPEMTVEGVDAIVLSGGSAFGLDAAGGVQAALREDGRGLLVAGHRVPLVPQAILFDLANGGAKDWGRHAPYRDLGYAAARAASSGAAAAGAFALGSVGAGTGATTATCKGGLGSASLLTPTGHTVAAVVAVNALGSVTLGDGPWFWAAPFEVADEFGGLGWPTPFLPIHRALRLKGLADDATTSGGALNGATTIGLVATDAVLTRAEARRLAIMADDGLARAVFPAHAPQDGDTIFAVATGRRPMPGGRLDLTILGHAAALVMARAIARGVFLATALPWAGAQPSWADRFGR